ncbi:MAG: SDR family oxidoreductase [Comamonadaceae bacterium]|nr:MAG: SDR family oxidoreductase [Comamonadaceae bacterium]
MFDLTGKTALVTGGNGGIGLAMARGLAQAGAMVVVAGRDAAKSASAVQALLGEGLKADAVEADVTKEASVAALVAEVLRRHGALNILVNNAGTNIRRAPAYGASKGGVVQLTRSLATAWAPDGIQANAVLPGWIDTELTRKARDQVQGLHERVLGRTPAGRWGAPADLAGIAVFLASSASDFITGTAIPVDGGYSIS